MIQIAYTIYKELLSLESTSIQADLFTTYKIVHNLIGVFLNDVGLGLSRNKTRSVGRKIEHKVHHSNIISSKYMLRHPPLWNSLPDGLITAKQLPTFKKQMQFWFKDIDSNFIG